MSKKKIYIITKDKYEGNHRTIGFVRDMGKHIYYDFLSHNVQLRTRKDGSHYSYHEDGTVWRTSQGVGKEQLTATTPLKKFNSYYDLCTTAFNTESLKDLKPFKESYRGKVIIIELDIASYESNFINLILDMIHIKFYDNFLKNPEASYPNKAKVFTRKLNKNIIIELTILADNDNLIIEPLKSGFNAKHYNKRFTANAKGASYTYEAGEAVLKS